MHSNLTILESSIHTGDTTWESFQLYPNARSIQHHTFQPYYLMTISFYGSHNLKECLLSKHPDKTQLHILVLLSQSPYNPNALVRPKHISQQYKFKGSYYPNASINRNYTLQHSKLNSPHYPNALIKRKNTFQHYKPKSPSDATTHPTTPPKDHEYRASGSVGDRQADRQADPTSQSQKASLNSSNIPPARQVARDSERHGDSDII